MGVSLLQDLGSLAVARRQFGFHEEFNEFVTGDLGTSLAADAGSSVAVGDEVGGVITITTGGTDNNEAMWKSTKELFKFANNKPLVFEARVQFTEANTDDANVFVGLADAAGANLMVDDGGGSKSSYSGVAFLKVDGATRWSIQSSVGSSKTTTDLTATNSIDKTAKTAGSSSYQTLRIEFIPISSTEADVNFWIDGVQVGKHSLTYTSATEMQAALYIKAGGSNSEVLKADYCDAWQDR